MSGTPGSSRAHRLRAYLPALGATLLFALALYALQHLMHDVHYREVVAELRALPWPALFLSAGATAIGYLTLMGYDWSALRYVRQHVPPARLALASFCGYALGNTFGFAVLSGGAVRYRIYGALGIEAGDIAKISVFCASAFGIGVTVVALGALAMHPVALTPVTPFAPGTLRAIGVTGLAAVGVLLAVRPRLGDVITLGPWRVELPSARLLLGQIGFSVLDIGFAAAALYFVIPDPGLPFVAFVAIFALASIAGVVSHVPGGLGVFEGVMIAGLAGRVSPPALAAGLVVYRAVYYLLPPWLKPHLPTPDELTRAAAVIRAQDDPEANFALVGDKALLFSGSGESFIMYGIQGRSWVALGAPVGRRDESRELLGEFMDLAEASGGRPALYQVGPAHLTLCLDAGLTLNKLGEEAEVSLSGFDLEGPARKDLRYAVRRGERDGLSFELRAPRHDEAFVDALRAISDAWLETKNAREKSFSLGRFAASYLQPSPLALVREGERITAFANVLTTDTRAGATIDLMRHLPDVHGLTMDYLFIRLMLELKSQGFGWFRLGMAPLSGLAELPHESAWNRLGGLVYRHAGHFYNFEGLRRFKQKFGPEWQPRYLATEGGLDPMVVAADITLLCGGGLRGVLGR